MRRTGIFQLAVVTGLVVLGAESAHGVVAVAVRDADGPTHEIRVVNNHASPVRVYVQDAKGRMYSLGRVSRSDFRVLEVSEEIAARGDLRIKVFPSEATGSLMGSDDGIRSRDLTLGAGDAVNVWVETDLTRSMIQVTKG